MTRKWLCENIEVIHSYAQARSCGDPPPLLADLVNQTGRMEIAVFLDDKYPDMEAVKASLLRGKAKGVRHVIPATARHTLALAGELGLDVLPAKLPPGRGTWRKTWRDWVLVCRCDHTLVFRKKSAQALAPFIAKVEEYPHLEAKVHIFEAGVAKAPRRTKGRQRA